MSDKKRVTFTASANSSAVKLGGGSKITGFQFNGAIATDTFTVQSSADGTTWRTLAGTIAGVARTFTLPTNPDTFNIPFPTDMEQPLEENVRLVLNNARSCTCDILTRHYAG